MGSLAELEKTIIFHSYFLENSKNFLNFTIHSLINFVNFLENQENLKGNTKTFRKKIENCKKSKNSQNIGKFR